MDVIIAEEGGMGRDASTHALSCPTLNLCLEGSLYSVSLQAPTQLRVSITLTAVHLLGYQRGSREYVLFPSKEDAAHFATPNRAAAGHLLSRSR